MKKGILILAILIMALGLVLTACGGSTGSQPTAAPAVTAPPATQPAANKSSIKVGLLASISGARPAEGKGEQAAVEAAVADINAAGGVNGRMLELVVQDDAFTPATAATAASRLIDAGAVAITGMATSDMQQAVQAVTERAKVVLVGSISNADGMTDGKPLSFRSAGENKTIAPLVVKFAKSYGVKNVGVVYDSGSYGQSMGQDMIDGAKAAGLNVVTTQTYQPNATNLSAQVLNLQQAKVDGILFAASVGSDSALFARTLVENGVKVPLFGHSGLLHPDAIKNGSDSFTQLPGVFAASPLDTSRADTMALYDRLAKVTGFALTDEHAAQTYDAIKIMAMGLTKSGGEGGQALATAIESIDHWEGLSGKKGSYFSFSKDRHTGLAGDYVVMYSWKNGKYGIAP
jgi:branched-chain amino acid transport system substrate-binding protein